MITRDYEITNNSVKWRLKKSKNDVVEIDELQRNFYQVYMYISILDPGMNDKQLYSLQ